MNTVDFNNMLNVATLGSINLGDLSVYSSNELTMMVVVCDDSLSVDVVFEDVLDCQKNESSDRGIQSKRW